MPEEKKPLEGDEMILQMLSEYISETFRDFIMAKAYMDLAYHTLRRTQSLMSLGSVYKAILADPKGDLILDAERQMNDLEVGSRVLRSAIAELEKAQRKKSSENPIITTNVNAGLH